MKKRFFLDRIDMDGYWPAVGQCPELALNINSGPAAPPFTLFDQAALGAQQATNRPVGVNERLFFNGVVPSVTRLAGSIRRVSSQPVPGRRGVFQ